MSTAAAPAAGIGIAARGSPAGLVALLVLLAWAPVPLGSNRGWSEALLAAGLLGLAFAVLVVALWRGEGLASRAGGAGAPAALLAAGAGFALLQVVALPAPLLGLLSPAAREAWSAAGVDGAASLSLDRAASAARGLHLASLAALLMLAVWWVSSWRRLWAACAAVLAVGVAQAVLGIGLALAEGSGWLAGGPVEGVGGTRGSYVNPNHFAGLLEMAFCVGLGMLLASSPGEPLPRRGRETAERALGFLLSPRLAIAGALLLLLVGLLWSGSRGALAALAVALAAVFALWLPPRRATGLAPRLAALATAGVLAVAAITVAGSGGLGRKLAAEGLDSNRLELAAAALAMAADYPLTGSGAGSFASVFPAYKSEALGFAFYRHAHNDYLETLAELGVPGAALVLGGPAWLLARALRRARRRTSRTARCLSAGAAAAATSLAVHGLYDFNLQIPANASMLVFVLALAWRGATLAPGPRPEVPRP